MSTLQNKNKFLKTFGSIKKKFILQSDTHL